jgi:hypothetical protein
MRPIFQKDLKYIMQKHHETTGEVYNFYRGRPVKRISFEYSENKLIK